MFNKNSNVFKLFSVGLLSVSLVACGGGGSNFSGSTLTTAQKQAIANVAIESADIFELVDVILTLTDQISVLDSGVLVCVTGSESSTIVNNAPTATFDAGDSITLNATNCVDSDGDGFNGTLSITGSTVAGATATNASFAGTGFFDDAAVNGSIQIIPSANYNPTGGSGSLAVSIDDFTVTDTGTTVSLKNGSYNLALSGSGYTYNIDHEITSNLFAGTVKAQTGTSGFTGTTSIDSFGDFVIESPLAGVMTITYPDGSTAAVDANTGSATTYSLSVDGTTTTELWDQ